uniref:Retinoblastomabinding protein 5like [Musca domestica] n=2 Tax=Caligidae TaxID=72034 RepID=A0A0K2UIS0_LEPSM
MNLELLESFGQNYPEENDGTLDCITMAITCQFNRFGTLLAVGCNDGRLVIWDFLTRGIAKIIQAHIHPVCSISWSRSGRQLASASTDNNVSIWDLLTGECEQRFRFPSPVLQAQFHPKFHRYILVSPMRTAAVVVDLEDGSHRLIPLDDENDSQIVASYDHRGKYIFTGNSKGKVSIFNSSNLELITSFRVSAQSTTAVKSIEFARRSKSFLVNTADRVIRVYRMDEVFNQPDGKDPDPTQKLQDLVNRTMWKKCCFSGDGEYVCAGSARQHALYIWEKSVGNLVKILHGTKGEILMDVVWHPVRPIVASISQGVVTVWAQQQVENWSAFAPDFKELDENVDYEERESEFDVEDEDKSIQLNEEEKDDDVEVDVSNNAAIPAFCSSDEDEEDKNALLYLPTAPEIEEPEEHWVHGVDGTNEDSSIKRTTSTDSKESSSPKKKKTKVTEVTLQNPPKDEVHPLLAKSSGKDKNLSNKRNSGRAKGKDKGKLNK